jgi:hypothetical protein
MKSMKILNNYYKIKPGRNKNGSKKRCTSRENYAITRDNFGVDERGFKELYEKVKDLITTSRSNPGNKKGRKCLLSPKGRLMLTLMWMKNGFRFRMLEFIFGVTKSFISRDLQHIIPILYNRLDEINLPDNPVPAFLGAIGMIDCTIHERERVNPGQSLLWRGDKKRHFLSLQLICNLEGVPIRIDIGLGHNNDVHMFNESSVGTWLVQNNVKLFADQGYSHPNLITPIKANNDAEQILLFRQYTYRSAVETVFSQAKNWLIAKYPFKQSIFFQEMVLMVIYQMIAKYMKDNPLRDISWYYGDYFNVNCE